MEGLLEDATRVGFAIFAGGFIAVSWLMGWFSEPDKMGDALGGYLYVFIMSFLPTGTLDIAIFFIAVLATELGLKPGEDLSTHIFLILLSYILLSALWHSIEYWVLGI